MRCITLIMGLLMSINLHATERVECEELFKGAIYNFYLENSCKFDKHISSAVRKEFENKNCTKLFSDDDMKKLNSEVLGDSYKKMKEIGRDEFCRKNRAPYDSLEKSYLQNTH